MFSGGKSHIYGSSHSNQRIEAWCSFLRRNRSGYWIDFFKDLVEQTTLQLGYTLQTILRRTTVGVKATMAGQRMQL